MEKEIEVDPKLAKASRIVEKWLLLGRNLADELARPDPTALAITLANAGPHRHRGII